MLLDESVKERWETMARVVADAGMTLWPWVEVARNPAMADAHPEWMAATGGHHDDWRRRFPKAPTAKPGEVDQGMALGSHRLRPGLRCPSRAPEATPRATCPGRGRECS